MDHQGPQEDGHNRIGGDSERKKRNERPTGRRVVGCLGSGHSLNRPFPKLLRMLRDLLLNGIGGEGGDDRASSRYNAQEEAEDRSPE